MNQLTNRVTAEQIENVERFMIAEGALVGAELKEALNLKHYFINGLYAREMTLPADFVLTGAIHKTDHIIVLSKGILALATEEDGAVVIEAPYTAMCKAGAKRIGVAVTDVVFTTFCHTDAQTIEEAEQELVCDTMQEYLAFKQARLS